jgi:transcriptional regulator with XRE-family HTH domain
MGSMRRRLQALVAMRRDLASGRARELRERAGLTQRELARLLDVTPATISRWESGDRRPTGTQAENYALLLQALRESHEP